MDTPLDRTRIRSTLRRMGNSTGMILPKAILDQLGLATGSRMELRVENGEVVASRVAPVVREGWGEAARRIGETDRTEDECAWAALPLGFDDEWQW